MATASPEARLLAVDDEPHIVELLSASLRFVGFKVFSATDGAEAITQARRSRPVRRTGAVRNWRRAPPGGCLPLPWP